MLKRELRTAILELSGKQCGIRQIARALKISRQAVRKVLFSRSATPPAIERPELAEPYRQQIQDLYLSCEGNLVRVHEELLADGAKLAYPTLTAFVRREQLGEKPKAPAGRYHFDPGQETQHDTSPVQIPIGGRKREGQIISSALCFSRMLFFQGAPQFQRFHCKVFLTDAFGFFEGVTEDVMIDNTHVVVSRGTGPDMVVVPEMAAFAERYGFTFHAHKVGDANRSARVEGPFWFIQRNFLPGRRFVDWPDFDAQAREWCIKVNSAYKRHLHAIPRELYAIERPYLKRLPVWVPEVYRLFQRIVDAEGYVNVNSNRYSVPPDWIGREVQVRETKAHIEIDGVRGGHVRHDRVIGEVDQRRLLKEHRYPRGQNPHKPQRAPEETAIASACPELADFVASLKKHGRKQSTLALRQLLRMVQEYPRQPLLVAIAEAAQYGLWDLDRVERMVLRRVAHDYFRLGPDEGDNDE
jgi:transposase